MKLTLRLIAVVGVVAALALAGVRVPAIQAQDAPNTFRGGAGKAVLGPVDLRAGLLVLRARHSGTGNFTVTLELPKPGIDPERDWESSDLMINIIGQFNGAAAIGVKRDGSYLIMVGQASGPYQITIEQPTGGPVETANQRDFSGKGQQVTPIFYLPAGTITLTLTYEPEKDFYYFNVWLYDMFGGAIGGQDDYQGRFLKVYGAYNGVVTLDVPIEGFYLLAVDTGSGATGAWTVHIDGP